MVTTFLIIFQLGIDNNFIKFRKTIDKRKFKCDNTKVQTNVFEKKGMEKIWEKKEQKI